jgi:hypothetical protein
MSTLTVSMVLKQIALLGNEINARATIEAVPGNLFRETLTFWRLVLYACLGAPIVIELCSQRLIRDR